MHTDFRRGEKEGGTLGLGLEIDILKINELQRITCRLNILINLHLKFIVCDLIEEWDLLTALFLILRYCLFQLKKLQ